MYKITSWIYFLFEISERNMSQYLLTVKVNYVFSTIEIMWYHETILLRKFL
jgi:hypothetical protein